MIDFSKIKKLAIDGVDLKSLAINGVQVWKSGPKNWVKYSTEADGVTIYNGGLGYKDGYRVRSGGEETTISYAACTGYIPMKKGDVLRIYPKFQNMNSVNTINFYDEGFVNLGQSNDNGSMYGICVNDRAGFATSINGDFSVLHLTTEAASRVAYVRITNQIGANVDVPSHITTGADMIITVNEEIE